MSRRIALTLLAAVVTFALSIVPSPTAAQGASAGQSADHRALVELGRRLFFDPEIGRAGRVSCAACHDPEHGFSDARVQSVDETGPLPRHSQPLTDLAGRGFHWDGEFDTVREIVEARVLPRDLVASAGIARSAGRVSEATAAGRTLDDARVRRRTGSGRAYYGDRAAPAAVAEGESPVDLRLAATGRYAKAFTAAFGSPTPTAPRVVDAVTAFVGSLRTTESRFDRFVAGRANAISPAAARGFAIFGGKAGCAACHPATPRDGRVPLTDGGFHDTGVAWDATRGEIVDGGRGAASMTRDDDGRFKTPSLRDVARRAPYMHDGRFATLADVVEYYDKGGTPHPGLDPKIRPLGLEKSEAADLVAFLESLSGDERAGLGAAALDRPKRLRVRVVDAFGRPRIGAVVTVVPAGDRLRGAPAVARPATAKTDADGAIEVPWPLATHVLLSFKGLDPALTSLVPDCESFVEATTVAADEALLSLPTGFCEDRPNLWLVTARGERAHPAAGLSRLRTLPNGRSVYAADCRGVVFDGRCVVMRDDGTVIGDIDPSKWRASATDLAPALPR